jgi:membrane associated rhomboid family serine protease
MLGARPPHAPASNDQSPTLRPGPLIPFSDSSAPLRTFPIVKVSIIALTTLVFLYEVSLGGLGMLFGNAGGELSAFFFRWGFIPEELTRGTPFTLPVAIRTPLPTEATIFSSMFIHGGFLHFAGNMMFLWVFGDNIEDRLGHLRFLIFYFVVGVVATLSHLLIDSHSQTPLVGASGAISGIMGAYLLLYPRNRVKVLVLFYIITVVEIQAFWLLGFWFLWQLAQGVLSVGLSQSVDVAFFAHVGGFAAGAGLMAVYKPFFMGPGDDGPVAKQPGDYWYRTRR